MHHDTNTEIFLHPQIKLINDSEVKQILDFRVDMVRSGCSLFSLYSTRPLGTLGVNTEVPE